MSRPLLTLMAASIAVALFSPRFPANAGPPTAFSLAVKQTGASANLCDDNKEFIEITVSDNGTTSSDKLPGAPFKIILDGTGSGMSPVHGTATIPTIPPASAAIFPVLVQTNFARGQISTLTAEIVNANGNVVAQQIPVATTTAMCAAPPATPTPTPSPAPSSTPWRFHESPGMVKMNERFEERMVSKSVGIEVLQPEDCSDYKKLIAKANATVDNGGAIGAIDVMEEMDALFFINPSENFLMGRYSSICSVGIEGHTYTPSPHLPFQDKVFDPATFYYFKGPLGGAGSPPEICHLYDTSTATVVFSSSDKAWQLRIAGSRVANFTVQSEALRAKWAVQHYPHRCTVPNTSYPFQPGAADYWY